MQTTKLSSKGQIIIPKALRMRYKWDSGQELTVIDTGDGVLLKASYPFETTEFKKVEACLKYSGKKVSLEDMGKAIQIGALKRKK